MFFRTVAELARIAVVANARGKKINAFFCLVLVALSPVLGVLDAMSELAQVSITAAAIGFKVATQLGLEELFIDFAARVCIAHNNK